MDRTWLLSLALSLFLLSSILAGCDAASPTPTFGGGSGPPNGMPEEQDIDSLEPPGEAPEPAPGASSMSGLLYSYTIHRVIPQTLVYLTPATGPKGTSVPPLLIGPEEDTGDIIMTTDDQGRIYQDDIPPGNYYLIVWAPYNWTIVEASPVVQRPRLVALKEGDLEVLGVLFVSWP